MCGFDRHLRRHRFMYMPNFYHAMISNLSFDPVQKKIVQITHSGNNL